MQANLKIRDSQKANTRRARLLATVLLCGCLFSGCTQNRSVFPPGNRTISPAPNSTSSMTNAERERALAEMRSLNERLGRFDSDNKDLHTQIARLQQKLNLANQEKRLLNQQLADTAKQLQRAGATNQSNQNRINMIRTSTNVGGATIRANSSLATRLDGIKLTGVDVWQDGDVARIDLPTDRMFVQGTYQLQQSGAKLLDQVAAEIKRNFPRQIIVIEGHTDNVPLAGTVATHHQVAATQTLAVFNYLSRGGYLPTKQMQTMAMGSNRPRFSNGDAAGRAKNRRIEIVIYPETYDR